MQLSNKCVWLFYKDDCCIRDGLALTSVSLQLHAAQVETLQKRAWQTFSFVFNPGWKLKDEMATTRPHILSMLSRPFHQQTFHPCLAQYCIYRGIPRREVPTAVLNSQKQGSRGTAASHWGSFNILLCQNSANCFMQKIRENTYYMKLKCAIRKTYRDMARYL